nr:unnamed protein product [Callosobruchus chinensis]
MTRYGFGVFILRAIVPALIASSAVLRPSFISLIYFVMLLYIPFINLTNEDRIHSGFFKYIMIFVPYQTGSIHLAFFCYTWSTEEILKEKNSHIRRWLKDAGLSWTFGLEGSEIMSWLGPEFAMILASILYNWAVRMMVIPVEEEKDRCREKGKILREQLLYVKASASRGKNVISCLLLLTAVWVHSIFGLYYFFCYLVLMTCWTLHKDKARTLILIMYLIMPVMILQMMWIYMNQIPYVQWCIPDDFWVHRLFGIHDLIRARPNYGPDFTRYVYSTGTMINLIYPVVVYTTYYCMVNEVFLLRTLNYLSAKEKWSLSRMKWKSNRKKPYPRLDDVKGRGKGSLFYFSFLDRSKNQFWNKVMNFAESIAPLISHHAYIWAICIMMLWSVTFINVMSFTLLLLGILLWAVPRRELITVICCFPVCIFSYVNMCYTYLLGLEEPLIQIQGKGKISILSFLEWDREATIEVLVKVSYTAFFWLTIHSYILEKKVQQNIALKRIASEISRTGSRFKKGSLLEMLIHRFFVQYWIVMMAACLYALAITGREMNIFRILNMFKYLLFMLILQLSFKVWRRILYVYMIFLILMSMFTMFVFYLYQFEYVVNFIKDTLHFSQEIMEDLGITYIKTSRDYLNRVLIPTLYIVMTMIQMNFFHKPFMRMTDENNTKQAEEDEEARLLYGTHMRRLMQMAAVTFRVMEVHLRKVVMAVMFLMCIFDACAVYFIALFPLCIAMLMGSLVRRIVILWAAVVVSVHTMARMVFALRYIDASDFDVVCNVTKHPEFKQVRRNTAYWLGYKKYDLLETPLYKQLLWPMMFVFASALWNIVAARQEISRKQHGLPPARDAVLFPEVTLREADTSLMNYMKYVFNYGYYRMGFEITMICVVLVITVRMDGYSIMYCVWLCIFLLLNRKTVRWVWPIFVGFIALSISWQYVMAVGLPPHWCVEYEWETQTYYWRVAQHFWFLADNYNPPPITKLVVEALLCLLATRQLHAFLNEIRFSRRPDFVYPGGSNDSIIKYFEKPGFLITVPDFTTYTTSTLDIAKRLFFHCFYWGAICIVFLGSVNRVEIFSLMYLCHVIVYLWFGINMYYKSLPLIHKYWNFLLAQNIFVIIMKMLLQAVGCFWLHQIPIKYCKYLRLAHIKCVRRFVDSASFDVMEENRYICRPSTNETFGIAWDFMIFFFLIIQKRIFGSYSCFLIIDNVKAELLLASRGAIFWSEIRDKVLQAIKDREKIMKEKISRKLEMVKQHARRVRGPLYESNITAHHTAMRSGDYFMFTSNDDDLEEDIFLGEDSSLENLTVDNHSFISLFSFMFKNNLRTTVRSYWDSEKQGHIFRVKPAREPDEDPEPYTWISRLLYLFRFCWVVLDLTAVNISSVLNTQVNQYAEVRTMIDKEKRLLKETTDYMLGVRFEGWWLPRGSYDTLLKRSRLKEPKIPPEEISVEKQSNFMKLIKALWLVTVSRSDILCYFFIIMNQVMLSQLITLPLTSMVFFWGSLSNPRPSKTFWIILTGYLQLVILLKCIFQFDLMPGNQEREVIEFQTKLHQPNPFHPSRLLGLYRQNFYYIWEMFALVAALLHRRYLKGIGFWTAKSDTTRIGTGNYSLENGEFRRYRARSTGSKEEFPKRLYALKSEKASILDNIVMSIGTIVLQYATGFREFYQRLLLHTSQEATDLYTVMFCFDLITLLIIFSEYPSFFERDETNETTMSYFQKDKIPVSFVLIIFSHFAALILDRCIYLRRSVFSKLIFHTMHCVWAQLWTFIMLPHEENGRMAKDKTAITMYYIFRCLYLMVSAYQIRCGYPSRIWGYFCCHKVGVLNCGLLWIYGKLPLLYEMRHCLDWMFTDTSMSIFEWFKMEDISYKVEFIKFKRMVEEDYSKEPGLEKTPLYKYMYGAVWCLLIISVIFLPMMMYSLGKESAPPNIPSKAVLTLHVTLEAPLYSNRATIYRLNKDDFELMKQVYNAFDESKSFMYSYKYYDIVALVFNTGGFPWMVRHQRRNLIAKKTLGAHPIYVKLALEIYLPLQDGAVTKLLGTTVTRPYPFSKKRKDFAKMIKAEQLDEVEPLHFSHLLPKFMKIKNHKMEVVDKLMLPDRHRMAETYRNLTVFAHKMPHEQRTVWWELTEQCDDMNYNRFLKHLPFHDCDTVMVVYVFSDRVVTLPGILKMIVGGTGVLALYGIYFIMFQHAIREFAIEDIDEIFFDENEIPNIRKLCRMVSLVYVCREFRNWEMEEWAYSRFVFCLRSRDTIQALRRDSPEEYEIF